MWSLGVIVYVLLTLARAQEWNLWRIIRAGQSNCIDSESFGKHLRTGFSEVSRVFSFDPCAHQMARVLLIRRLLSGMKT
jgi:hypothetical protein